jgi:hypothetical protein
MTDERGTIRSIAWHQVFPALRVLAAVRMALNFKALLLAAIAIAGMVAGWRLLGELFHDPGATHPLVESDLAAYTTWPWERPIEMPPTDRMTSLEIWYANSPLMAAWNELAMPMKRMYQIAEAPTFAGFMYLLSCGLWTLFIWTFFGGAISRQTAVAFARQENVSLGALARFVHGKAGAYLAAPLFPLLGSALIALPMAGLGLLLRFDWGVAVIGIAGWPLILFGGFLMAFLLLGLFFGFPLMWAAISAEGTDSFGALSHAYAYVYQRPIKYLGYAVLAALAGVLGWYLVTLFAYWIYELALWSVSWGSGVERLNAVRTVGGTEGLAALGARAMAFWTNAMMLLAYAFVFSYFWTATTVIYFLLRRLVDATALDEVYMPGEADKRGLPPLKMGTDGVPTVADESAQPTA